MNNPQFADKVVNAMIDLDTGDSSVISKHINEPHDAVMDMMKYLQSSMPYAFAGTSGYGDSIDIYIRPSYLPTMKEFMRTGGFTAEQERKEQEDARKRYKEGLEVVNLQQAIKAASSSKRMAIWALIISGIVAIVEIIKFIKAID